VPGEERDAVPRLVAEQERSEIISIDNSHQTEVGGQSALPHSRRLPGSDVVVLDPDRHPTDEVLGVPDGRDRQHDARPGQACDSWQVSIARLFVVLRDSLL
jgi:hypothetical protein